MSPTSSPWAPNDAFCASSSDRPVTAGTVMRMANPRTSRKARASRVGYFATTLPGLGGLLRAQIDATPALESGDEIGFDGRADIVFFVLRPGADLDLRALRIAEDVFVVVGHARAGPLRRLASSIISREGLEQALSVRARIGQPPRASMSFRVIARVTDESNFKRTELRDAISQAVAAHRPRWRFADPAQLELWTLEHRRGRFVAGLRLSTKSMRQHGGGRATERQGALRPVVAAAMVSLAGRSPGRLLDPCCGSGTILGEALAAGWQADGSDIDDDAVLISRANVAGATITCADATNLPQADGTFDAVVSNLPFGRQFEVRDARRWVTDVLSEAARVTRSGGRVVVLVPPPVPHLIDGLSSIESYPLKLLGVRTKLWVFARDGSPAGVRRKTAASQRA